jgi:thymidine phosphorylase
VDPAVGIRVHVKPGASVDRGEPIFDVFYRDRSRLPRARDFLVAAIEISDTPPQPRRLILGEIS